MKSNFKHKSIFVLVTGLFSGGTWAACDITPLFTILAEGQTVNLTATCSEALKSVNWMMDDGANSPTSLTSNVSLNQATAQPIQFTTPINLSDGVTTTTSYTFYVTGIDNADGQTAVITPPASRATVVVKPASNVVAGSGTLDTLVAGSCGLAQGKTYSSMPTGTGGGADNACATGNQILKITSSTAFSWTCASPNGGSDSSCYALYSPPVNGVCGSANTSSVSSAPSGTQACSSGTANFTDSTAGDGTYNWTCKGANNGSDSGACSATKVVTPVAGTCGSASGQTFASQPSSNLCGAGDGNPTWSDTVASDGAWNWTCGGANGGSASGTCSANNSNTPVTGSCGSANGGTFSSQPSSNLCNAGTSNFTDPSGSDGAFNWDCNGANGGGNASCSATYSQPTTGGNCGALPPGVSVSTNWTFLGQTRATVNANSILAFKYDHDGRVPLGQFDWTGSAALLGFYSSCPGVNDIGCKQAKYQFDGVYKYRSDTTDPYGCILTTGNTYYFNLQAGATGGFPAVNHRNR